MVWRLGELADGAPGLSVGGMIGWRVDGLAGRRVDALTGKLTCRLASSELDGVCVGLAGGRSLLFCSFPHILYIRQHILSLTFISLHIQSLLTENFSLLSLLKWPAFRLPKWLIWECFMSFLLPLAYIFVHFRYWRP